MPRLALPTVFIFLFACSHERDQVSREQATPSKSFGQAITVHEWTSLSEIAKSPLPFKNKTIATQGTVTRVCQERGCWMAIRDERTEATIRMHGHAFFVPTSSSGKHARVQGTLTFTKDGRECDEMELAASPLSGQGSSVEFSIDATGVELD